MENLARVEIGTIEIGSRLYCAAAPNLRTGDALTADFGQRMLNWVVYTQNGIEAAGAIPTLLEMTWEAVRLREFPHCPSRLRCLFLWDEEIRARDFASRRPHPTGLYEVEVFECSRSLRADMELISYLETPETVASLMRRARRYWSAERSQTPEILLEGAARIVRELPPASA